MTGGVPRSDYNLRPAAEKKHSEVMRSHWITYDVRQRGERFALDLVLQGGNEHRICYLLYRTTESARSDLCINTRSGVAVAVRLSTVWLKPNSITLAGSDLAPNMFGASSEVVRSWFEAEIWPII